MGIGLTQTMRLSVENGIKRERESILLARVHLIARFLETWLVLNLSTFFFSEHLQSCVSSLCYHYGISQTYAKMQFIQRCKQDLASYSIRLKMRQ